MIKAIISKIIIVIVIISTSLGAFWFFKTSVTKKQILAMVDSSKSVISASSISVSGFPMEQIVTIEGIKFKPFVNLSFSKTPFNPEIEIKKLQARAGILSGEFILSKLEGVSFKKKDGEDNFVEFNQLPKSKFSFVGGKLNKFSYQDSGYKVFDVTKNILSENGNSLFNFDSIISGEEYHNKIKADFKDVAIFQFANVQKSTSIANLPEAEVKIDINKTNEYSNDSKTVVFQQKPIQNLKENKPVVADVSASNVSSEKVKQQIVDNAIVDSKKNFSIDIEYVVVKPSSKSLVGLPSPDVQNNPVNDVAQDKPSLQSLTVNNFEIFTPFYKINFRGQVSAFQKDNFPVSRLSVRIEKIDNVLDYIKKFNIEAFQVKEDNLNNHVSNSNNEVASIPSEKNSPVNISSSDVVDNKESKIDLITVIKNLSKKNPATNDEIAVFDFFQDQGKALIINEISLPEIISQISSNSNSIKNDQIIPIENAPNTANNVSIPEQPIKNGVAPILK